MVLILLNHPHSELMLKTELEVTGMACEMCEAHMVETIRDAFPGTHFKTLRASHRKNLVEMVTDQPLDERVLKKAIHETGYKTGTCSVSEARPSFWAKLFGAR